MVDGSYIVSLLGCANLIELVSIKQKNNSFSFSFYIPIEFKTLSNYSKQTLLAGGFIAVCIASTDYAQFANSYPNILKDNVTQTVR